MVKKIVGLTRRVLDTAVLLGDIPTNPAARIQLPREKEKGNREEKIVYLTESEAQEVINAFSGEPLEAMVYITLYYGLRRSEILGLQWSAIDFEKDTMAIRHVVVKSRTVEAKDTTKSYNSRRSFKLLPEVKELLLNLKHEQEMLRQFYGNTYIENDYVFKHDNGKPYLPDYVTRKFQKVLAAHGLRKMRFHDLRHTTASVLFDKGWDVNEIREWLGHADIETTANIYTHLSHVKAIALAKNMENTFTLAK
jgi:integrase